MPRYGSFGLVIPGTILMILTVALVFAGGSRAESVAGTWTSTVVGEGYVDDTWPATFHYDAKLTLSSGGSGSLWLRCTKVDVNQPGWESSQQMVGRSSTVNVDYTVFGSSVTINIHDSMGGTYALTVTVSGGRMSGSGSYTDLSYVTNSWTMDLTRGGGGSTALGVPGLGGIAAAASIGGFLAGFIVSLLPPPHYMGGSILPQSQTALGTPYAPSQSLVLDHKISSMANQPGGVTRPLPDVPRMRMQFDPIQFPNVEMGRTTDIRPTDVHPTDVLSKRACPNCGSTLMVTAGGWSCPFCNRAPPGGLDR